MNPSYCKLLCPTGSEHGTCECRSPRDCRKPMPRLQHQPPDHRPPLSRGQVAVVLLVLALLAAAALAVRA